ncbi:MAG: hypothetical protein J6I95_03070, partial [Anaerotignum sp.]|nr:hypothetical protein [Anaerotignum sp.]
QIIFFVTKAYVLQSIVLVLFLCFYKLFLKNCPESYLRNGLVSERGMKPTSRCKEEGEILGTFTFSEGDSQDAI